MAMTSVRCMCSGVMLPSPHSVISLSEMLTMRCSAYLAVLISASTTSPTFSVSGTGASSALSLPSSSHGLMLYPLNGSVTVCPWLMSSAISGIRMSLLMCRERRVGLVCRSRWVSNHETTSLCCLLWLRWSDRFCHVFPHPISSTSMR